MTGDVTGAKRGRTRRSEERGGKKVYLELRQRRQKKRLPSGVISRTLVRKTKKDPEKLEI